MRRFTSLPQRAAREPQIVLFLTHVYNTKTYLKKLFDKRFRPIFSSAFQWCRQFSRNFSLSPSKSTKRVISQKSVILIFFYPLDRKLSIFYVAKDIFQRVPDMFSARNRMRKSFWKWKWKISEKLHTSLESWGKNTSETLIKPFFEVHFRIIHMS